jgi:hypothetical protein
MKVSDEHSCLTCGENCSENDRGGTSQRCMECKFGIEELLRTWHTRWYPRDTIPVDVREVVSQGTPL